MLRPTDKEIADATALGINPEGKYGPQLREAIKRARRRRSSSLWKLPQYVRVAEHAIMLELEPIERETVAQLQQRISDKIHQLLRQKGIGKDAYVIMAHNNPHLHNQPLRVVREVVVWQDGTPFVYVKPFEKRTRPTVATKLALSASLVE